jgi:hypothetical protein
VEILSLDFSKYKSFRVWSAGIRARQHAQRAQQFFALRADAGKNARAPTTDSALTPVRALWWRLNLPLMRWNQYRER